MLSLPTKLVDRRFSRHTRKRTLYIEVATTASIPPAEWDGGSRTECSLLGPSGSVGAWDNERLERPKGWPAFTHGSYDLQPGEVILKGGTFRGKPAGITLIVHPDSLRMLFPQFSGDTPAEVIADWLAEQGYDTDSLNRQIRRAREAIAFNPGIELG